MFKLAAVIAQDLIENKMEHKSCPHCDARKKEEKASEEFSLALLISLVPMLVFTLFGQVGLF